MIISFVINLRGSSIIPAEFYDNARYVILRQDQ